VLCEKPLAHELGEAKALRDFAVQASVVLLVGENYYYRDDFNISIRKLHRWLKRTNIPILTMASATNGKPFMTPFIIAILFRARPRNATPIKS
jgi:predicted dehydrogenase